MSSCIVHLHTYIYTAMDSTFLKSDCLGYSHNPIVFFNADNLCQTTDPDFRKGAARKVSALLKSDLEAMRDYLDATRDTSTSTLGGRKWLASTPAVDISDIPPREFCGPSYATS